MRDELIKVGQFNLGFNNFIGSNYREYNIYKSRGLASHLISKHHYESLRYIDRLNEIIENPDYIGRNPRENDGFELIKIFDKNILIGIKIDADNDIMYVATMYELQEQKLQRRLESGRIQIFN